MDRTRDHGPGEEQLTLDAEILDLDSTGRPLVQRPRQPRGGRLTRMSVSAPSAIVGAFLVSALTIGAAGSTLTASNFGGPTSPTGDATTDQGTSGAGSESELLGHGGIGDGDEPGAPGEGGTGSGGEGEYDEPKPDDPGATEEPKATEEPTETEKPAPAPDVEPAKIELGLKLGDDGRVHVDWTGCARDGFDAWKVVRSSNDSVTLPAGSGDTIVAAIDEQDKTWFVDAGAPKGKTSWYRVFGVAWQDGYVVLCRSNLAKITTPAPEPEPTPDPKPEPLGLALSLKDAGVYVDWTACGIDGFDVYKVVRSKDAEIHWPLGDYDTLVGATEDATALLDKGAPAGKKLYYRVYCLDKGADGYRVLRYSSIRSITTPSVDPGPKPVPSAMAFEIDVTGEGVVLHWEPCGGESFRYYKVIRSRYENPSYLPWTDGSEVIAVIENASTTTFVDTSADGGTWFYRVQSIGTWNGGKVLLGQTAVHDVTLD